MNNKHQMSYRIAFSVAFLFIFAGLLSTTAVLSADLNEPTQTGTITLIKNVIKDDGGNAAPNDFQLTIDGSPADSGVAYLLPADTDYTIDETQLSGYTFISITGDPKCPVDLGGTITLGEGDNITCTITNDDVGFNFTPDGGLLTSESGGSDTFTVALDTKPIDDVTLALQSSDTTEGTIDKSSLTFTDANWHIPQTVTVTGVDDPVKVADGNAPYSIITGPVTTTDPDYGSLDPVLDIPDISAVNSDNDIPGISVSPNTDLWTSEGGATETVQVLLQTKPTHPVLLTITSDVSEGTVSPSSLTINPTPWPPNTPKEFTITGVDDCKSGGDNYEVSITATSDDPVYNGRKKDLNVTNYDAPTIEWVDPVKDEQYYDVEGFGPILLKVKSSCPEPISKVRFYRWVVSIGDSLIIGEDLTDPYTAVVDPAELESGINQINQVRAFAYGPPVENQTFSIHKLIYIVKEPKNYIFLPTISKNP